MIPDRRPTLVTQRLVLRPPVRDDAPHIQRLAAAREIAAGTATIPHPYPEGAAEAWIERASAEIAQGSGAPFVVLRRQGSVLIGNVGLRIEAEHRRAELGYWIGVPHWGQGYASEASLAVLRFAFEELGLHRVFANHFRRNPASGRVLEKLGMTYEGRMRSHVLKWDSFEDLECYGILQSDWRLRHGPGAAQEAPG